MIAFKLKDWGHDPMPAFRALENAEAQVPGLGVQALPQAFRLIGRWLIREEHLPAVTAPRSSPAALATVLRADGVSGLPLGLRKLGAARIVLPLAADAVLLKANLRAFYFRQGMTLKLPNPGRPKSAARIANEIRYRQGFTGLAHVRTPALLHIPPDRSFIAEEMLKADAVTPGLLTGKDIASRYLDWQVANGITHEPLRTLFDAAAVWQSLADYCREFSIGLDPRIAETFSSLDSGSQAAMAICNGDLTISNLMYAPDTLFIIDWEWAGKDLVFSDAVRLATQIPGFAEDFLAAFAKHEMASSTNAIPARAQFVAACVHVAAQRIARRSDFTSQVDDKAYGKRLKGRIANITRLCRALVMPG